MADIAAFATALGVSLFGCLLTLLTKRWHVSWSGDFQDSGVQKHHQGVTPRVGLLPLVLGLSLAPLSLTVTGHTLAAATRDLVLCLLAAGLPIAILGLWEDLTKSVRPMIRLLGACASSIVGLVVFDVRLGTVPIPPFGDLAGLAAVGIPLTILMVAGFVNAMNIVDGLNGLAGGIAVLMLTSTAAVAVMVGDSNLATACIIIAGAVVGFLLVNFPRGAIFLGDGGAYLLGFLLVQIWILLVSRNPGEVSPWFIMAIAFHPTMETIFSMYRRRFRARRAHAMAPDRLHLHTLLYRRWARPWLNTVTMPAAWMPNALASAAIVAVLVVPCALALMAPHSALWGFAVMFSMVFVYLAVFQRLCRFRIFRQHHRAVRKAYPGTTPITDSVLSTEKVSQGSSGV